MQEFLETAFGVVENDLTWWQMSLRAVGVFFAAMFIIRVGTPRIFGEHTALDIILGVVYGSILSRAATGNSAFWPTVAAAFTLILLHKGLAALAYHHGGRVGNIIKGSPEALVKNGELQRDVMRGCSVTEHDLAEAMRKSGSDADLSQIKAAYLERSGDISIIMKDRK